MNPVGDNSVHHKENHRLRTSEVARRAFPWRALTDCCCCELTVNLTVTTQHIEISIMGMTNKMPSFHHLAFNCCSLWGERKEQELTKTALLRQKCFVLFLYSTTD